MMRRGVRERRAKRVGAPISYGMVAQNLKVVNRNLLLIRYPFERLAKSFKRGELRRRWGGKVTIGKTRSKTEVRGKRVRGVTRVVRAGQGACLLGRCEGDSKPAHAKPAYAAPKISPRACRPPTWPTRPLSYFRSRLTSNCAKCSSLTAPGKLATSSP